MKPSEKCKKAGLKSLAELSEITHISRQTLINWSKNNNKFFDFIVFGASCIKKLKNKGI